MLKKFIYILTILGLLLYFLSSCVYALEPESPVIYEGIDVSNWQGYIDYKEVKNSGIQIVYIKSSQGNNIRDPYFRINYENAKANGLNIGFYHYVTARSTDEAIKEAEYFSSVISGTTPNCKLAMDFENFGNLNATEINSIARTFLIKVKELTGKDVIIYSDASNARNIFSPELARDYPLWIAEYGVETPTSNVNWSSWIGFQYTSHGRVNGINGFVDRDKFTEDIFLDSSESINTPGNTVNQIIKYTVQRGNTLSGIALEYGTTVREIAGLNGIKNPNLIFTGEILEIDTTRSYDEIVSDAFDMNHIIYTIKRGDTLTSIAKKFGISIESIAILNHIQDINLIYAGDRLRISA